MSELGDQLRAARADLGLSRAELARIWGRSPRAVSKIERGEMPGTSYAGAIQALAGGRLTVTPPRRTTKAGAVAKVRGKAGSPSVTPPPEPKGGTRTTYDAGRQRRTVVFVPHRRQRGRGKAAVIIVAEIGRGRATGRRVRGYVAQTEYSPAGLAVTYPPQGTPTPRSVLPAYDAVADSIPDYQLHSGDGYFVIVLTDGPSK